MSRFARLLIVSKQLLLSRVIHESFASLSEYMSSEQFQFVSKLLDGLLQRINRFRFLVRGAVQLIQLFLQRVDGCLLRLD